MTKRDTNDNTIEPLTSLQAAMTAVDNGENPLQSDGNDFGAVKSSPITIADRIEYSKLFSTEQTLLFGAIPATDHDTLTAQAAAEKIVKGEDLVDGITTTRATTHGRYRDTARIAQSFKRVVHMELDDRLARGQPDLTDQQLESIDLICTKLARIISGDSNEPDHWHDIGGYAQIALVDK